MDGSGGAAARRVGTERRRLRGASGVALSGCGTWVLAWSSSEVRVWERATGRLEVSAQGEILRAGFSAGGDAVGWALSGRGVEVAALGKKGEVERRSVGWDGFAASRHAVALGPQLAQAAWIARRSLHVGAVGTGELCWTRLLGRGLSGSVVVAVSRDGAHVVVRDYLEVQVFAMADGAPCGRFALPAGTVAGLTTCAAGAATWRYDYAAGASTLEVWGLPGGGLVRSVMLPGQVMASALAADGAAACALQVGASRRLARVGPSGAVEEAALVGRSPSCLGVASGGTWVVGAHHREAEVRLWRGEDGAEVRLSAGHRDAVRRLCFAPGTGWLVSAGACGVLVVTDAATGQVVQTAEGSWWDLEASPTPGEVLATTQAGALWALGLPGLAPRRQLVEAGSGVCVRAVSGLWPEVLLAGHPDHLDPEAAPAAGPLRWHRLADGATREEATSFALTDGFEVSGDGAQLALRDFGSLVLLEGSTGALEARLSWALGHTGAALTGALAWSPGGGAWAVGARDGVVGAVVDGALEVQGRLAGGAAITALCFAAGGQVLLAGDEAGRLTWCAWPSMAPLGSRVAHAGAITALACSPDGRWWASGSADTTAAIWEASALLEAQGEVQQP